jgi:hypothetical protein
MQHANKMGAWRRIAIAVVLGLSSVPAHAVARRAAIAMKGFGGTKVAKAKAVTAPERHDLWAAPDPEIESQLAAMGQKGLSIQNFLNPRLFEDPATLAGVRERLRAGKVVVLRDAFHPAFAEKTHRELTSSLVPWKLHENYMKCGFHFKHHNVYDRSQYSKWMNITLAIFSNEGTRRWIEELSGCDCSGDVVGSPSYYQPSDHSLPHTDWDGQRTVSYVWHLSKDWKPEWGGALYWAQDAHADATYAASYNTLVLFTVTTMSAHFVTTVSPLAEGQRLAFNGWWQSGWVPTAADTRLDEVLATPASRLQVTREQLSAIQQLLADPSQGIAPDRRARLQAQFAQLMTEFFPGKKAA